MTGNRRTIAILALLVGALATAACAPAPGGGGGGTPAAAASCLSGNAGATPNLVSQPRHLIQWQLNPATVACAGVQVTLYSFLIVNGEERLLSTNVFAPPIGAGTPLNGTTVDISPFVTRATAPSTNPAYVYGQAYVTANGRTPSLVTSLDVRRVCNDMPAGCQP